MKANKRKTANIKKKDDFFRKTDSKFKPFKKPFRGKNPGFTWNEKNDRSAQLKPSKSPDTSPNPKRGGFFIKPSTSGKSENSAAESEITVEPSAGGAVQPQQKAGTEEKRPFDKRKWRLQKYSNKYKLEQWQEKQKKALEREYYKQKKFDNSATFDVQKIYEDDEDKDESGGEKPARKVKRFEKPHEKFERIKQEKAERKAEAARLRAEREEALKKKKREREEKNKLLRRKTKKGQPIMKYRMEQLLEQIQKSMT